MLCQKTKKKNQVK
uniref:Uncharacterized protein n=1 Tax=Rhizophora mucronata TaxID=61149 RepID=A0A2P2PZG1_RHIMU